MAPSRLDNRDAHLRMRTGSRFDSQNSENSHKYDQIPVSDTEGPHEGSHRMEDDSDHFEGGVEEYQDGDSLDEELELLKMRKEQRQKLMLMYGGIGAVVLIIFIIICAACCCKGSGELADDDPMNPKNQGSKIMGMSKGVCIGVTIGIVVAVGAIIGGILACTVCNCCGTDTTTEATTG